MHFRLKSPSTTEQQQLLLEADVNGELDRMQVSLTDAQKQILLSFLTVNPTCTVQAALRFCYARKFDLNRIQVLFNNYVNAVEKSGLNLVTINDVLEELRTAKLYCPGGRDKEGAGLFVICARNHKARQFPMESTLKLAFYLAELVTSHPRTQRNGSDSEVVTFLTETVFSTNLDQNGSARVELLRQHRPPRRWKLHCVNRQITC